MRFENDEVATFDSFDVTQKLLLKEPVTVVFMSGEMLLDRNVHDDVVAEADFDVTLIQEAGAYRIVVWAA